MKLLFPHNANRATARQSGVALVATLIMLSLVTFMVVAFLGVARRERRSIEAVTSAGEARTAMETGLARAQADVIARLVTFGDKWNYGLLVPTNYQSAGFVGNLASSANVNYTNAMALGLGGWLTNLGNLQFDARAPVFSPNYTNITPYDVLASEPNQGRYYLDFNRDGMFEFTDRIQSGDPQWLAILENADQVHGPNNRFGARYTYLVAPAGKSFDLNFIHNQAKRGGILGGAPGFAAERYYRNLGLGPQEFNIASMLTEMAPTHYGYNYLVANNASSIFFPGSRDAFRDARDLLLFRFNGSGANLPTLTAHFGLAPANALLSSQFDVLGDGPLMTATNLTINTDANNIRWPGGSNINAAAQHYFDLNESFIRTRNYSTTFTTNLQYVGSNNLTATAAGERDRRAYYNLLSTLGTESWPVDGKMNLNWSNIVFTATNITIGSSGGDVSGFTSWDADYFFFNAAELMFRASVNPSVIVNTNWTGFGGGEPNVLLTNYYFGTTFWGTNASFFLSVTNIRVHPSSLYSPETHRILQLAANLYDATTSNTAAPAYPTLFRPYFAFSTNGWPSNDSVFIVGYTTNITDTNLLSLPSYELTDPFGRLALYQDVNSFVNAAGIGTNQSCLLAGVPVIIGAKKGYPNFNEFGAQTVLTATRRLELVKTNATNFGPGAVVMTNQAVVVGLTNVYGLEAWNSYAGNFPQPANVNRQLRLEAAHVADVALGWFVNRHLTNSYELFSSTNFMLVYTNRTTNTVLTNILGNAWPGTAAPGLFPSFKSFFFTNGLLGTNGALARGYAFATNLPPYPGFTNGGFFPVSPYVPASPAAFNRSNGFPDLRLHLTVTNSVRYALYEPNSNRVVDFVSLANLITGTNISRPQSAVVFPAGIGKWWRLAHGLIDGMDLLFYTTGTLPGGMVSGTYYYVRDVTPNDFNVALTPGGPAIGLGGGGGTHWYVAPTDENLGIALGSDGRNNGGQFWLTSRQGGVMAPTEGVSNQLAFSLNTNITSVASNLWRQYSPTANPLREVDRARRFLGTNTVFPVNQSASPTITLQLGFTPTRVVSISAAWEVNDPLVHYTIQDLTSPFVPVVMRSHGLYMAIEPPGTVWRVDTSPRPPQPVAYNLAYQPWGLVSDLSQFPSYTNVASFQNGSGQGYYELKTPAYDQRFKDPGIFNSDQWDFPQRKFANLGWIGRVHRGTPWQTVYLKSDLPNPTNWFYWARSGETNPTNDWRLVEVFSTAINADATRSLLSVNQTNSVAWAALGGTLVLTNNTFAAANWPMVISPASPQLTNIIGGLTNGLINAKLSVGMWQPTANYSPNDILAYHNAPYYATGDSVPLFKRYYRSVTGTNINQNPYVQTSLGNFSYWTNVYPWVVSTIYGTNDWVVYRDVSYISLGSGSGNQPDISPTAWEPAPGRSFTRMGYVLSTPELSVQSPYLNVGKPWNGARSYAPGERVYWQGWYYEAIRNAPSGSPPPNPHGMYSDPYYRGFTLWWPLQSPGLPAPANARIMLDAINDSFVERIPQQTLGLFMLEQNPRLAIYAYGQSLRPAERGVYVSPGPYQLMVTNYQITGEVASRTVVRIEGIPENGLLPRPLPPGAPPQVTPRAIIESFRLLSSDY